jgi:hypothetical protein
MKHDYDLFEKFPDGSSLWRDSVSGFEKTQLFLQGLAERSENQFYAINLATGEVLAFNSERIAHGSRSNEVFNSSACGHSFPGAARHL